MSVEQPDVQEMIGFCAAEAEKRKWFAGAQAFLEGFEQLQRQQADAEAARDKAYAARDAALAEITTAKAKYDREREAALADVARVLRQKAELDQERHDHALSALKSIAMETDVARKTKEQVDADLVRARLAAAREEDALTARLAPLRSEEQAIRERVAGVAAALQG